MLHNFIIKELIISLFVNSNALLTAVFVKKCVTRNISTYHSHHAKVILMQTNL